MDRQALKRANGALGDGTGAGILRAMNADQRDSLRPVSTSNFFMLPSRPIMVSPSQCPNSPRACTARGRLRMLTLSPLRTRARPYQTVGGERSADAHAGCPVVRDRARCGRRSPGRSPKAGSNTQAGRELFNLVNSRCRTHEPHSRGISAAGLAGWLTER